MAFNFTLHQSHSGTNPVDVSHGEKGLSLVFVFSCERAIQLAQNKTAAKTASMLTYLANAAAHKLFSLLSFLSR